MADQQAACEPATSGLEHAPAPRTRSRNWAATVVAAAMIAVLLAATVAGFRFVQSDPLPVVSNSPVIAVELGDSSWPTAQITGTLRQAGGCLLVDDAVAMFPDGSTWAQPDEVVLADGTVWRVGQRIVGGGGFLDAEELTGTDLGDRATTTAAACADDLGLADVVLIRP